jgi:hypothetical protein
MKRLFAFLVTAAVILVVSCKKDDPAVSFNAVGFWKGQWSIDPATSPNQNFLWLLINSDGTIRVYYDDTDTSGSNKASGTYTIASDSIINWYVADWNELSTAKIRNNSTKLVGTWGYSPSNNSEGQLQVTKQ